MGQCAQRWLSRSLLDGALAGVFNRFALLRDCLLVRSLYVVMSALGLILSTALGASAALTSAGSADQPAPMGDRDMADSAFVQVEIRDGDKKVKHPGFRLEHEAEGLFEIKAGANYVVAVTIQEGDGKTYKLDVSFKKGSKVITSGTVNAKAGEWVTLKKGKASVSVNVDPTGDVDKSRKKKIEGDKGDDPLGDSPLH